MQKLLISLAILSVALALQVGPYNKCITDHCEVIFTDKMCTDDTDCVAKKDTYLAAVAANTDCATVNTAINGKAETDMTYLNYEEADKCFAALREESLKHFGTTIYHLCKF